VTHLLDPRFTRRNIYLWRTGGLIFYARAGNATQARGILNDVLEVQGEPTACLSANELAAILMGVPPKQILEGRR
jgi:hypothetical protein